MGSEGDGMRRLTQTMCDTLVYIPMAEVLIVLKASMSVLPQEWCYMR